MKQAYSASASHGVIPSYGATTPKDTLPFVWALMLLRGHLASASRGTALATDDYETRHCPTMRHA
jgi:hypothetical protein